MMKAPGLILQRKWFALWLATGFAFTLAMSNTIAVCPGAPSPSRIARWEEPLDGRPLLDWATLGDRGEDSTPPISPYGHPEGSWLWQLLGLIDSTHRLS